MGWVESDNGPAFSPLLLNGKAEEGVGHVHHDKPDHTTPDHMRVEILMHTEKFCKKSDNFSNCYPFLVDHSRHSPNGNPDLSRGQFICIVAKQ